MKPSIPSGTRDFGPAEMQKRQYILTTLRKNFELFGYEPIETPTMENSSTLMGKYGDEGDKLIFKILNSGDYLGKLSEETFDKYKAKDYRTVDNTKNGGKIDKQQFTKENINLFTKEISEKALRYDLTVPLARFVVMNQHKLAFPFKRYQIQPVWRADRPQKGRYREFYQCDADVIGSDSLINELDLISMIDKSFQELQLPIVLKINNRKILSGIAEVIEEPERIIEITVAIDKIDKIGLEGVNKELKEKGISDNAVNQLRDLFELTGNIASRIKQLKLFLGNSKIGLKGIEELEFLFNNIPTLNLCSKTDIELDITLARGLNYYTGTIFEVKANAGTFTPSILGGGRYDDLTGIFGLPNMSGVGISFGVDRIYDVMEELSVFPESISKSSSTTLLFTHFDTETQHYCLQLAAELRKNEISCEVYPDITKKLTKQLDYANKKNIPFVCTVGSNEIEKGAFSLKHMSTGNKQELNITDMIHFIKTELHDVHN